MGVLRSARSLRFNKNENEAAINSRSFGSPPGGGPSSTACWSMTMTTDGTTRV